jgi:hypothetical protein
MGYMNYTQLFASTLTIIVIIITIAFPIFIVIFFKVNAGKLKNKRLKESYGALFEDVELDRSYSYLYYPIFTIRRFFFVILLIFATELPSL